MPLPLISNGDSGLVSRNKINAGLALLPVAGVINTIDYGAIADGGSHPLSTVYSTLAAAQAVYPFATALTQEIDYCACKQASNVAFGIDGSEHAGVNSNLNLSLHINHGNYWFGNDTWLIRNLVGGVIYGDGNGATQIGGSNSVAILQFDGLWYTTLRDFRIAQFNAAALTALDIDGNVPGHPYATRGVQAITLVNLLIGASGGTYAFTWTRQGNGVGGPGAQGDNGTFINLHLINAQTLYFQEGYNSLNNQFIGGDFQVFTTGAFISNGSCHFFGTSFESTLEFTQVTNSLFGYDIVFGFGGVNEPVLIHGTRSESFRHIRNGGAQMGVLNGVTVLGGPGQWVNNTVYAPGDVVCPVIPTGRIYQTVAGGTSGGAEPTWPHNAWWGLVGLDGGLSGSTVVDGTCTWQEYIFFSIQNTSGGIDPKSVSSCAGVLYPYIAGPTIKIATSDFDYNRWRGATVGFPTTPIQDVNVDATAGLVNIRMPEESPAGATTFEITKTDDTLNPVVINYGSATGVFGDLVATYLTSPYEKIRLTYGAGPSGQRAFYKERSEIWSYITPATVTAISAVVTTFGINPQDKFLLDTTTGPITVNLPGPVLMSVIVARPGMTFRIRDPQGTWNGNNVTVNPQGYNINSAAVNYVASINNSEIVFTYIDDTIGWKTQVF